MQVPRTKKTPKELPEYFVPKVPYPAWDADWDGRRDLIVGATSERGMVRNLHILAIAAVVMSVIATAILVAILFDDYPDMMWGLVASLGLPAP